MLAIWNVKLYIEVEHCSNIFLTFVLAQGAKLAIYISHDSTRSLYNGRIYDRATMTHFIYIIMFMLRPESSYQWSQRLLLVGYWKSVQPGWCLTWNQLDCGNASWSKGLHSSLSCTGCRCTTAPIVRRGSTSCSTSPCSRLNAMQLTVRSKTMSLAALRRQIKVTSAARIVHRQVACRSSRRPSQTLPS